MRITLTIATAAAALAAMATSLLLRPRTASAHCDTWGGPAVTDGQRALQTGNVNIALKWVHADGSAELQRIFEQARAARVLGDEAELVADQWFLENLVRIHRAGEGAPFTGILPADTLIDPRVRAADEAIELGILDPLVDLVLQADLPELQERFEIAMELKDFDENDVAAGRRYIDAYVSFFKLAEGEDDDHHGHHSEHGHGEHHTAST